MPIDVLTIIFRFTLFGLLAYKIVQIIKSQVIPFLKEELNIEHKQRTELLEKEKLLVSTQHRLENQISHQKKTFTVLEKSIHLWQEYLVKQKEHNELETKNVAAHVTEKRKIQQKHLVLAKDGAYIIPQACEQVNNEFITLYQGEYGKKNLNLFITQMASQNNIKSS